MSLKPRERMALWIGAAIVIVGAIVRLAPGMSAPAGGDSLNGLLARMETFAKLKATVEKEQAAAKIEIPKVGPSEQEARVRESLGKLVQSGGLKLGPLKRMERASRAAGSELSADFQFDTAGQYDQFVKFLATIENEKTPFKIMELRIESGPGNIGNQGGGGGAPNRGGGGERNPDGQVHGSMKVRAYFFPKVFLDPKAEEKKPESGPRPPQGPEKPAQTPQQTTSATTEVKSETKEKPAASPPPAEATPAPAKKSGRYRIRMQMGDQSIEIVLDGRTVTMPGGETKDLSDEELANWRDKLPPGAEVIEE